MDKVQKPSVNECCTPSSEPYRVCCIECLTAEEKPVGNVHRRLKTFPEILISMETQRIVGETCEVIGTCEPQPSQRAMQGRSPWALTPWWFCLIWRRKEQLSVLWHMLLVCGHWRAEFIEFGPKIKWKMSFSCLTAQDCTLICQQRTPSQNYSGLLSQSTMQPRYGSIKFPSYWFAKECRSRTVARDDDAVIAEMMMRDSNIS
jgi:hypothetical protein